MWNADQFKEHKPIQTATAMHGFKMTIIFYLILPIVFYLSVSWIYFGPKNPAYLINRFFCAGGDPEFYVWFINWWPFALSHGLNPFVTTYAWSTSGLNLAWLTSMPSIALLFAPLTYIIGAQATFNIIAILSPALAATACYSLVYYLTRKVIGSLLAGYIFGFSSYELGQLLGHTQLYFIAAIPLVVLLVILRINKSIKRWPFIIALAILESFEFQASLEIFATAAFLSAISLITFYLATPKETKIEIISSSIDIALSLIPFTIITSPYIYYLLTSFRSLPQQMAPATVYSTDILNFIIPTPITRIGRTLFSNISSHYTGNYTEEGAYLGAPLLLIIYHFTIARWNEKYTIPLFTLFLIVAIFSLGDFLHVNGVITHVPMPWWIVSHFPLMNSALPLRLSLYTSLIAAVIVGLWLAKSRSKYSSAFKYGATLLSCIMLSPNMHVYNWSKPHIPQVFSKKYIAGVLTKKENILILPYGGSGTYYQYASGMFFSQYGNYLGFNPLAFKNHPYPATFPLQNGIVPPSFICDIESFCVKHQIKKIFATKGTKIQVIDALYNSGWAKSNVGSTVIFTVPAHPRTAVLSGQYWSLHLCAKKYHWMGRSLSIRNYNYPAVLEISGMYLPGNVIEKLDISYSGFTKIFTVVHATNIHIRIPANGKVNILAQNTFVPHEINHKLSDRRPLSVLVRLRPSF